MLSNWQLFVYEVKEDKSISPEVHLIPQADSITYFKQETLTLSGHNDFGGFLFPIPKCNNWLVEYSWRIWMLMGFSGLIKVSSTFVLWFSSCVPYKDLAEFSLQLLSYNFCNTRLLSMLTGADACCSPLTSWDRKVPHSCHKWLSIPSLCWGAPKYGVFAVWNSMRGDQRTF